MKQESVETIIKNWEGSDFICGFCFIKDFILTPDSCLLTTEKH